jgi:glucans biosynthesis protein
MDRRGFLAGTLPFGIELLRGVEHAIAAGAPQGLILGRPQRFSFDNLRRFAKALATKPYPPENPPAPELVSSIDFDVNQKIKFRPQYSLWQNGPASFPARFFHLNRYVGLPAKIHAVVGNTAREIFFSPAYFDYGGTGLEKKLPPDIGFSGFRLMNGRGIESDWLAFQGASYFRSSGSEDQYGASARGIAVDTALSTQEEFPRFTSFWLAGSAHGALTIFALLEGPSLTGAYKIEASRGDGVVTEVHADLFTRADIQRLGIAPLTSMYWYSKSNYRQGSDWRPEIHDSDGLALWTGKGERIWRPLVDPPSIQTNSFLDTNPKGFGLLQRDRDFDHYQDDGAFYNRRPSLWVEPIGNWGEGAVQLVEIPTDDEVHDNVVAYWQPKNPVGSGSALSIDYRIYWRSVEPTFPSTLAKVMATRTGRGGAPGRPSPKNSHKFVIDFEGGPLADMAQRYDVTPVTTLSRGKADNAYSIKIVGTKRWRAFFDVGLEGNQPLDIRCYLRLGDKTLSETWLYQYFPTVA